MANVVIICGGTGTGKSRSFKGLDPKETYLINVLGKALPFPEDVYSKEKKNMFVPESPYYKQVKEAIIGVSSSRPDVKTIIVDDAGYIMVDELFKRGKEIGYTKFTDIGLHMQQILDSAKAQRDDLTIVFTFHEDDEYSDKIRIGKKLKTIGMMLEDKYNPLAIVTIALFSDVTFNTQGKAEYSFITNRMMKDGLVIPAKSPEGMFEDIRIPNDFAEVIKSIRSYYKTSKKQVVNA